MRKRSLALISKYDVIKRLVNDFDDLTPIEQCDEMIDYSLKFAFASKIAEEQRINNNEESVIMRPRISRQEES
jgi:hypothetical protein